MASTAISENVLSLFSWRFYRSKSFFFALIGEISIKSEFNSVKIQIYYGGFRHLGIFTAS